MDTNVLEGELVLAGNKTVPRKIPFFVSFFFYCFCKVALIRLAVVVENIFKMKWDEYVYILIYYMCIYSYN